MKGLTPIWTNAVIRVALDLCILPYDSRDILQALIDPEREWMVLGIKSFLRKLQAGVS